APPADVPSPSKLGRPLTLQEKLAAARAGAGGGAAPAPAAAKPAAAKPAAAKAAPAAAPKRELPPLDKITDPRDLAEALRPTGAKKDQEIAAAAKAKEAPAKPAKEKEKKPDSVLPRPAKGAAGATTPAAAESPALQARRRSFLYSSAALLWVAWGSFTAGMVAF